jgi:hypothetical protein
MLWLDLDSSRWESMLGVRGEQKLLFQCREEEEYHWETREYKYPQIWNNNGSFRKVGTSGQDPETFGNW